MMRFPLAIALVLATTSMAMADARTQLLASLRYELPRYVSGVDLDALSTTKLGRIKTVLHGDGSDSVKQQHVRSIIGGRFSLFGVLKSK